MKSLVRLNCLACLLSHQLHLIVKAQTMEYLKNLQLSNTEESLGQDKTLRQTSHKHFTSIWQLFIFCINLLEHTVGNPSAIEGQTVNIKNLRTGLWAWCPMSLPLNSKGLMSLGRDEMACQTSEEHFTSIWRAECKTMLCDDLNFFFLQKYLKLCMSFPIE